MKRIPLRDKTGKVKKWAFVDDEDYEWLSRNRWFAHKGNSSFYAYRGLRIRKGLRQMFPMHRAILQAKKGQLVDHVNGNGLDNRRQNLRIATKGQNSMNSRRRKTNISGFIGVCWCRQTNRWRAEITRGGTTYWLGRFDTKEEAARKRDEAAKKHHGKFARLNFPKTEIC